MATVVWIGCKSERDGNHDDWRLGVAKKAIEYTVYARYAAVLGVTIMASSLEEAREKAETLKSDSFLDVPGECIDNRFQIIGVQESDWNLD